MKKKFNELFKQFMEGFDNTISHFRAGLEQIPEEYNGKSINKNFDMGQNNLKDLTNGPEKVDGHFSVNDNLLTSLAGAPVYADRFSIDNNPTLQKLEGIDKMVYKTFTCANCGLKDLTGLPVTRTLDVSNNPLQSLAGLERNKKYKIVKVTGTGISRDDVENYAEEKGIKINSIQD